jgi:hypothetical protein
MHPYSLSSSPHAKVKVHGSMERLDFLCLADQSDLSQNKHRKAAYFLVNGEKTDETNLTVIFTGK